MDHATRFPLTTTPASPEARPRSWTRPSQAAAYWVPRSVPSYQPMRWLEATSPYQVSRLGEGMAVGVFCPVGRRYTVLPVIPVGCPAPSWTSQATPVSEAAIAVTAWFFLSVPA